MAIPVLFKLGFAESACIFPLTYVEYASSNVIAFMAICDKFLCDEAVCEE